MGCIMNNQLQCKVDLMIKNFKSLKEGFSWNNSLTNHFGAVFHAIRENNVDIIALEKIKKYIKEETGAFSYFRGTNEAVFMNLLYFEDDYKEFFRSTLAVYDKLKDVGFSRSVYLPLAAYTIVKEATFDMYDYRIDRMIKIYEAMKKKHFWLTNAEDYIFAAMLSITDLEVDNIIENAEECYKTLNEKGFNKGNALQAICHTLATNDESKEDKVRRVISLYNRLENKKVKLGHFSLYLLGALALINDDDERIVDDIKEVNEYLSNTKGYGAWSITKDMRLILAVSLVANRYLEDLKNSGLEIAIGNSINSMIIAQQTAIIAACSASAAAAAAASSGS